MTDVIDLAKTLISRKSITPDDAGCQCVLEERLKTLGFQCESMPFANVDNLYARYGTHSPLVLFAGHTDVVPPGPESAWLSPPFQPTIRDGYLYGRGAVDMKSAIACMVAATEKFLNENQNPSGSIAFLITSDEEGNAEHGTQKVIAELQKRNEQIDYCIIGEASSEATLGDQIRIGRRGSLHGKLIVHGKQGHVAYPHLVKNPIHLALLALSELSETKWDEGNESFPPTTLQITNIHSGTGALNVTPQSLEVLFNLRFSTVLSIDEIKERAEAIFRKYKLMYQLDWNLGGNPFLTKQGKLITATTSAIKEVTGQDTKLSTGGGTSDGRFIATTGAEIVEVGVLNATAHHINECVRIEDLHQLVEIYYRLLRKLLCK